MNEIYQQIISIIYGVWQKRIYAVTVAWIICIVGWVIVAQVPNRYESNARIHVDAENLLKPLLGNMTVRNNIYEQIRMMRQTLISRPNIEKVIRLTDLDITRQNEDPEDLITQMMEDIEIDIHAANLFKISYSSTDPAISKKVVQSLLNIFIEEKLGDSRSDLSSALRFIEEQIRTYELQLEAAEQRSSEFRQLNMAYLSGEGTYFVKLEKSMTEAESVKLLIVELTNKRNQLRGHLENTAPFIPSRGMGPAFGGTVASGSSLGPRVAMLEQRLDELYARGYKDQHPDVRILMNQINMMKDKLTVEETEFAQALESGDAEALQKRGNVMPNPIYDQISIKLIDIEGEIASLQARYTQRKTAVAELKSMAKRIPEVEAEFARLNRDYGTIKNNYNQLLAKRESAKMSTNLEAKVDQVQFRVIDPPQEAREPTSPNRLILVLVVLVLGLGSGVGVAFILSQMHSTFSTEQRLREIFSIPVLGSISVLPSLEEMRLNKRKLVLFTIMLASLFISCASVYVLMNLFHSPVV